MICYVNYENEEKFKQKYFITSLMLKAILMAILIYPYIKKIREHDFFLD